MGYDTSAICVGGGELFIDGASVGLIKGDVVYASGETNIEIDGTLQFPGQTVKVIPVGKKPTIRFNCIESSLAAIQKAFSESTIVAGSGFNELPVGMLTDKPVRHVTYYGVAPDGFQRRLDFPLCQAIDPSELKVSGNSETEVGFTFRVLADTTATKTKRFGSIRDYTS